MDRSLLTLLALMDWLYEQVNPLCVVLFVMLMGTLFLLGMTVVGVCGAHA